MRTRHLIKVGQIYHTVNPIGTNGNLITERSYLDSHCLNKSIRLEGQLIFHDTDFDLIIDRIRNGVSVIEYRIELLDIFGNVVRTINTLLNTIDSLTNFTTRVITCNTMYNRTGIDVIIDNIKNDVPNLVNINNYTVGLRPNPNLVQAVNNPQARLYINPPNEVIVFNREEEDKNTFQDFLKFAMNGYSLLETYVSNIEFESPVIDDPNEFGTTTIGIGMYNNDANENTKIDVLNIEIGGNTVKYGEIDNFPTILKFPANNFSFTAFDMLEAICNCFNYRWVYIAETKTVILKHVRTLLYNDNTTIPATILDEGIFSFKSNEPDKVDRLIYKYPELDILQGSNTDFDAGAVTNRWIMNNYHLGNLQNELIEDRKFRFYNKDSDIDFDTFTTFYTSFPNQEIRDTFKGKFCIIECTPWFDNTDVYQTLDSKAENLFLENHNLTNGKRYDKFYKDERNMMNVEYNDIIVDDGEYEETIINLETSALSGSAFNIEEVQINTSSLEFLNQDSYNTSFILGNDQVIDNKISIGLDSGEIRISGVFLDNPYNE